MDQRQILSALDKLHSLILIRALEKLVINYDPDQPRDPKGTPTGGQWTSGGASAEYKKLESREQIRDWADRYRYDIIPKLTDKQRERLDQYKRNSRYHVPLNTYLRTGEYDQQTSAWKSQAEMRSAITAIDNALAKSQIPENITVYRGMPSELLPENAIGLEFQDLGYGSTSLDFKLAEKFARWTREDGFTPAIIEIRVPKGTDGIFLDALYDNEESEILLPRGMTYRIVSEETKPVYRYLIVEVVK